MNNYCMDIDLGTPFLVEGFNPYSISKTHSILDQSVIHSDLLSLLDDLDLKVIYIEVFFKHPFEKNPIHADDGPSDMSKLNWIFGGGRSVMNWWTPKIGEQYKPIEVVTDINSSALCYPEDSVDLVHTQAIGFPSIIQSGVPHNITMGNEPRWCYSLVFFTKDIRRLTFVQTIDLFKKYIK